MLKIFRMAGMLMLLLCFSTPSGFALLSSPHQSIDVCQIFGSVYIEDDPQYADFLVYEEDSEAFADILVFEVDDRLWANKPGLWHFTETKGFQDFSIYFVESRGKADFSVYFINSEFFAGCNQ